jgi:hypothetical protein
MMTGAKSLRHYMPARFFGDTLTHCGPQLFAGLCFRTEFVERSRVRAHWASRPEELHLQPLIERSVNLSTHSAPIS